MKKETVAYLRIANASDYSINIQESRIKRYANSLGVSIDNVYIDNGYSGGNFDRPALKKLLADVKKGKINTIYISEMARLGRDTVKLLYYVKEYFPKYSVKLVAINGRNEIMEDVIFYNRYSALDIEKERMCN